MSDVSSFPHSRRLQLQPVVGVTSEASRHTARTATVPAPGTSWAPAPSSSWSAFRSVAPSSKKARSQSAVREIKKSVDLWSMEVVRNKLQLAEVRSQTYVRFAESDVSLLHITDLVQSHFEAQGVVPCDNRIILVDNRGVPFADDDGTRGRIYVTSMHAQYA